MASQVTANTAPRRLSPLRILGTDMPRDPSFLGVLHRFRTQSWGVIMVAMKRHRTYFNTMTRELRKHGVPPGLVFLAGVESAFHVRLHSGKEAVGLWQFIPKTAERYGLKITPWIDERRDVLKSTRAAARYLRDLHRMFGAWDMAVAAYNCGEHNLARVVQRCPGMSIWEIRRNPVCRLSTETKEHVARIFAQLYFWKYPPRNRPWPETLPTIRYTTVKTPGPVFLEDVAKAIHMEPKELYDLNAELSAWATPPGERYPLKVPQQNLRATRQFFSQSRSRRIPVWLRTHTLRPGTTMTSLTRRYGVSEAILRKINRLAEDDDIKDLRSLLIPLPQRRWSWTAKQLPILERYALRVQAFQWMHRPSTRFSQTYAHAQKRHVDRTEQKIRQERAKLEQRLAEQRRLLALAEAKKRKQRNHHRYRRHKRTRYAQNSTDTAQGAGSTWKRRRRWMADAGKDWSSRISRQAEHCYQVQAGDSWWRIAQKFDRYYHELMQFNPKIRQLRPGQWISVSPRKTCGSSQRRQPACYRIKSGDSWWRISRRFGLSITKLRQLNRQVQTLHVGRTLRLKPGTSCRTSRR